MTLTDQQVLIANGYLQVTGAKPRPYDPHLDEIKSEYRKNSGALTVVKNFLYYGYLPSWDCLSALVTLDDSALRDWWKTAEAALKELTADNRQMDDFVVYQNFPREVINMGEFEYWTKQILMYFGFDKEYFRETPVARDPLFENTKPRVLQLADERTLQTVYHNLLQNPSRWTVDQEAQAKHLLARLEITHFGMDEVSFRENGVRVIGQLLQTQPKVNVRIDDATDVLRLAALLSEGDVSLRTAFRFKSLPKATRRVMCAMLERSKNLRADASERPKLWKRFFRNLHPGDYPQFERVSQIYDELYNGRLNSFASRVEKGIRERDSDVLNLLSNRPGDFVRRFHHLYSCFGGRAVERLASLAPRLATLQLLKLLRYAETVNNRAQFIYAPRGQWSKIQLSLNTKKPFDEEALAQIRKSLSTVLEDRLKRAFPEGCQVDPQVDAIKLQTNDQELAPYGRGTAFPIPSEMKFLRTASYWENTGNTSWFDNSWNFFDATWQPVGTVCWDAMRWGSGKNTAAIFSGDPVNGKELKGRACQMIDLYVDRLLEKGVRYAVWNILSFNSIPFDKVSGEVLATLQWGEEPEKGKLYEPGRAQMVFPLTGNSLTKYIAYIDLEARQLIYIDANLPGKVHSAQRNASILAERMPAFLEYLHSLPSVGDLFYHASEGSTPVLYSDKDTALEDAEAQAYVFQPQNQNNLFQQIDLGKLLVSKE